MRRTSERSRWERRPIFLPAALLVALGVALSGCGAGDGPVARQDAPEDAPEPIVAPPADGEVPPARPDSPAPVAGGEPGRPAQPGESDDRVAIQVNDQTMTFAEFEEELQGQMQRLQQQLGGMQASPEMAQRLGMIRENMKQQLAKQMITRMLLEDFIATAEMEVSEEEIDEQWNDIVEQYPNVEAFEQVLKEEGVTAAEAREQVAKQVKFDKLMDRELGDGEVTDAEAQAFYDAQPDEFSNPAQVRARHILIKHREGAEEAIRSLHKLIEDGEDFATLARENSECPSSEQGGDLGFFSEDQMVEPFARQAFAMQPGEVSPPVETQFGFHVIKVEERREAGKTDYTEVEKAIKEHLGRQRAQVQHQEFIARLRNAAEITVNIELPAPPPALFPETDEMAP